MTTQCAYMKAAYPELSGEDTCWKHRHEPRVFRLAAAIARSIHGCDPTDEQTAWFLDDADAVVDDWRDVVDTWQVKSLGYPESLRGVSHLLRINGVEYVCPDSEWEPATPVKRSTWEAEQT